MAGAALRAAGAADFRAAGVAVLRAAGVAGVRVAGAPVWRAAGVTDFRGAGVAALRAAGVVGWRATVGMGLTVAKLGARRDPRVPAPVSGGSTGRRGYGPVMGPVGLWTTALDALSAARAADAAARLEEQGWAALWFGEAYGREAFTNAGMLLGATRRMVVATGIANVYGRDAVAMNAASRLLADQYPGRFVLGMGVSHRPLVERTRGHAYAAPVATMREYLAAMATAPFLAAGEGRPTVVLAALGPNMLALARDAADGAHPYLTTPSHTALARQALGPGKLLAVEQGVALTTDRETFLRRAHAHLEIYTGLPNYRNHWLRLGFSEEDLCRGGSDRLAEALIVHGDEQAVRMRVAQHLDAGADHVCVQVLGENPAQLRAEDLARLAAALL